MSTSRLIKKYPNRRLYDTKTSNYITLAEVKLLVLCNTDFRVVDAKSNEDLTRSILLQIILDEESTQGAPMFTSAVLSQIIRFYGHAMQGMMGPYLEKSVHSFIDMQQKLQEQARSLYGETPKLDTKVWSQFFKNQPSGMPNLMGNYLEQSANMFIEVEEQMRKQALSFFGAFPSNPGPGASSGGDGPVDEESRVEEETRVKEEKNKAESKPPVEDKLSS